MKLASAPFFSASSAPKPQTQFGRWDGDTSSDGTTGSPPINPDKPGNNHDVTVQKFASNHQTDKFTRTRFSSEPDVLDVPKTKDTPIVPPGGPPPDVDINAEPFG